MGVVASVKATPFCIDVGTSPLHCAIHGRDGLSWGRSLLLRSKRRKGIDLALLHLQWLKALKKDPCCYCGGKGGSIEHIVPRTVLKGTHWENKSGACQKCNSKKSNQKLIWFLVIHRKFLGTKCK